MRVRYRLEFEGINFETARVNDPPYLTARHGEGFAGVEVERQRRFQSIHVELTGWRPLRCFAVAPVRAEGRRLMPHRAAMER